MPRTKKTSAASETKPVRVRKIKTTSRFNFQQYFSSLRNNLTENRSKYLRYALVLVAVVLIGTLAFLNKQWFVVAVVNRQPITTIEYYQTLKTKDAKAVLNEIIQTKLINQEASRLNVSASEDDINKKVKEVEDQLGGSEQLKQALEQSSLTETQFRQNVKTQILVEKILGDKIKVEDKEIDDYIAQNPQDPNVTGSANSGPNRDAIREQLRSTKLNENFSSWYTDLEKKASILRFI